MEAARPHALSSGYQHRRRISGGCINVPSVFGNTRFNFPFGQDGCHSRRDFNKRAQRQVATPGTRFRAADLIEGVGALADVQHLGI
jgi:hypothetical protein